MLFRKHSLNEKFGIQEDIPAITDLYYEAKKDLKDQATKDPDPESGYARKA